MPDPTPAVMRVVEAARLTSPALAELLVTRLARATWAGVVFHGTKRAFAEFDRAYCGASDPGLAGPAFYFAPDAEQAASFAESPHYGLHPSTHPGRAAAHDVSGPQVIPALILLEQPAIVVDGIAPDGRRLTEIHPQGIAHASGLAWQRDLRRAGHDGVLFQTTGGEVTQVVAFESHQIVPALAPGSARAWRLGELRLEPSRSTATPSRPRRR